MMYSTELMIIHDFDVFRAQFCPPEADPELVVDSNAMLAFSVAAQCFQVISRWRA
jgi:hypothetical protein